MWWFLYGAAKTIWEHRKKESIFFLKIFYILFLPKVYKISSLSCLVKNIHFIRTITLTNQLWFLFKNKLISDSSRLWRSISFFFFFFFLKNKNNNCDRQPDIKGPMSSGVFKENGVVVEGTGAGGKSRAVRVPICPFPPPSLSGPLSLFPLPLLAT